MFTQANTFLRKASKPAGMWRLKNLNKADVIARFSH
jgi:hypothetical protein